MAITKLEIRRCPDPNSRVCKDFIGCKTILRTPEVGIRNDTLNELIIIILGGAKYYLPSTALLSVLELLIHRKIINVSFINNILESVRKGNILTSQPAFLDCVGFTLLMMIMLSIFPSFSYYNFEWSILFKKSYRDNLIKSEVKRLERMATRRGFTNGEEFRKELDAYNLYLVKEKLIDYAIQHFFEYDWNKTYQLPNPQTLDIYADDILINENNWQDILDGLCQWNIVRFFDNQHPMVEQVLSRGIISEIRPSLQLKKEFKQNQYL